MDTQAFQQSLSLHAGRMAGMGQERLHSSRTLEPKVKLEIQASPLTIRLNLLKEILAVPTCSRQEDGMVAFLIEHVRQQGAARCGEIVVDEWNNVFIRKGRADYKGKSPQQRPSL